jgi:ketosteroid isomerase-like protein
VRAGYHAAGSSRCGILGENGQRRHQVPAGPPRSRSATSSTDVVRASFEAYRAQDYDAARRLLAEDFVFTSPQDDHITKSTFLKRCFPTAGRFVSQEILHLVEAGDDGVFVPYEYELTTGERHRNTEFSTVRAGQLVETQVFFGGRV